MNLPAVRFATLLVVIASGWLAGCETISGASDFTTRSNSLSDGGRDGGSDSDATEDDDGALEDLQAAEAGD
jgi:predicted small secreted protein